MRITRFDSVPWLHRGFVQRPGHRTLNPKTRVRVPHPLPSRRIAQAGAPALEASLLGSTPRSASNATPRYRTDPITLRAREDVRWRFENPGLYVPSSTGLGRRPLKAEEEGSIPPGTTNTRVWRNGRRTGLRNQRRKAWRFDSSHAHQYGACRGWLPKRS